MPNHGQKATVRGCWICRLRRKKCDGNQPACGGCRALEIACYPKVAGKPDWMDGGPKQMEMTQRLKQQIREGTASRREKKRLERDRGQGEGATFVITSARDFGDPLSRTASSRTNSAALDPPRPEEETLSLPISMAAAAIGNMGPHALHSEAAVPMSGLGEGGQEPPAGNASYEFSRQTPPPEEWPSIPGTVTADTLKGCEVNFIMIYLDYAFPFLFPFYRPPMALTPRGWLLAFLQRDRAIYHAVISLSAYYFLTALRDASPRPGSPSHAQCKASIWEQVGRQADACFGRIQRELAELGLKGAAATTTERARAMQSIVQLLIFDVFVGRSAQWQAHLTPALTLFEEIYRGHRPIPSAHAHALTPPLSTNPSPSVTKTPSLLQPRGLLGVLDELLPESQTSLQKPMPFNLLIWDPDQAAFRFFAAVLIYIDIVAATSLGRAPALACYHGDDTLLLLSRAEDPRRSHPSWSQPASVAAPLDLSHFFGVHNWALLAVSEIAALDAWKKACGRAGTLSVVELVDRARLISDRIDAGLATLGDDDDEDEEEEDDDDSFSVSAHSSSPTATPRRRDGGDGRDEDNNKNDSATARPFYDPPCRPRHKGLSRRPTRIWAHAARIYLSVVVSGWQPRAGPVRRSVARVLALLRSFGGCGCGCDSGGAEVRALSWPLCVAACLALEEAGERDGFRGLLLRVGGPGAMSGLLDAGRVAEAVWSRGSVAGGEGWDFVGCFGVLGPPVLLV